MDKYTRDKSFWRWQNKVIIGLMNKLEDDTGILFCDASPSLEEECHSVMDDQSLYKKRSKMIRRLEEYNAIQPA